MAEHIPRPTMQIDEGLTEERARVLRWFDRRIHNRPSVFVGALEALQSGENGLQVESIDSLEAADAALNEDAFKSTALPAATILEVLRLRLDRYVEYDDDTEDTLANDEVHAELLKKPKDLGVNLVKVGEMKTVTRSNPEAAPVRDQLRLNRLRHYAARVALYNTEAKQHYRQLRSAG